MNWRELSTAPEMWRPRPRKKIKGTRSAKKIRITRGNRDPEARFLWAPAFDSPRFNAIADQIPKVVQINRKGQKLSESMARERKRDRETEREGFTEGILRNRRRQEWKLKANASERLKIHWWGKESEMGRSVNSSKAPGFCIFIF